jgi:hypothetical protein
LRRRLRHIRGHLAIRDLLDGGNEHHEKRDAQCLVRAGYGHDEGCAEGESTEQNGLDQPPAVHRCSELVRRRIAMNSQSLDRLPILAANRFPRLGVRATRRPSELRMFV